MKRKLWVLGVLVVGVVVAAGVGPSKARAGITTCAQSAVYPFAAWGDGSPYTLAPNGDFAFGAAGWSLAAGARVIGENNELSAGANSLLLPSGASATSSYACVKLADPASRFFLRRVSGNGRLRVDITYRTVLGIITLTRNLGYASAGGAWQPSPKYGHFLDNLLGTLAVNSGLSASIRFKFTAVGGSFQVDDLYVDPLIQI
jgi:hypothetical protein